MTPELVKKIENGDGLTDQELAVALAFYGTMVEGLRLLGPHHHLSWVSVSETLRRLDGFHDARRVQKGEGRRHG